jgi:AAA family ATP:ADP antiporter
MRDRTAGLARTTLKRIVDVRDEEITALFWSCGYFFCLLASYYVLRPLREQAGLAVGKDKLADLFTWTFVGMLVATPLFAALVTRYPRRKFIPWVYRFFIANLLVFFVLIRFAPAEVVTGAWTVFFPWLSVFNLFAVSVFWSFMADLYRLQQGKRLFGFIAVGGSLGAIAGSALTEALAERIGPIQLLLVSALFLEASVHCVRRLVGLFHVGDELAGIPARRDSTEGQRRATGAERHATRAERHVDGGQPQPPIEQIEHGGLFTGLRLVFQSSFLGLICVYMFLYSSCATVLYFEQAHIVDAWNPDRGAQTALFARIDLWVNLITMAMQVFLTGRIVARLGIGFGLFLQPLVGALALLALAVSPTVGVLVAFQVLFRSVHYATSRPSREMLFTIVGREAKYKSKNFIDTFVFRGGDALAARLFDGMKGLGLQGVALATVPLVVIWGFVGIALGRKQTELARSHADGAPLSRPEVVR